MKQKLWIKLRVFLSFSIFIIFIINIFSFALYFFTIHTFRDDLEKNIKNQAWVIKSFIDLDEKSFNTLPNKQVEQINDLWFFFYVWKNNNDSQYLDWIYSYSNELIFKELYKNFTIIVWKDITDINKIQSSFIEIIILLNVLIIFFTFVISYLITRQVLIPLKKLSDYFSNFDIYNSPKLVLDNYWESEIWKLNKFINKFIRDIRHIFDSQKSFIQDTSHELKTPLMQIETNLDLLENNHLDEKEKSRLNQIRTSINNINEIISNISFILRWDEKILKKENINLEKYFKEFIKKYELLAKIKNIKIILKCKSNFYISSNNYYLDRLFGNLLSNSINYNKWNNNIEILIDNNRVIICDKWIWINKEELSKVFDRFYRSKNSNLYSRDWSWLWLAIVKKICNMFDWKIDIESEEWKGTKVEVMFLIN